MKEKTKNFLIVLVLLVVFAVLIVSTYLVTRPQSPSKPPLAKANIPKRTDIQAPRKKPSQFVYAKTTCKIRKGPGTKYSVIRKASQGEKLEFISFEGDWYKLKVPAGRPQEWVHKSVVVTDQEKLSK
jgi:uncharacterized protein YgiM (DUF1202 family)